MFACTAIDKKKAKRECQSKKEERDLERIDERTRRGRREKSTNIAKHHLSVHMRKHREQDMVTTVVGSDIADVALPKNAMHNNSHYRRQNSAHAMNC